ncbi:MAG: hypothetical protein CBB96_01345 [Gammaproteobacteria bacterium TMED36]|nr:MAG: hypothetical protein CBB96_01345 [Gammaproteobacteria bacterium TMED36]|tara:strand:+ start:3544 stop:5091 length:1548 start_codon:yes stop_codon:yes gene_type:complete
MSKNPNLLVQDIQSLEIASPLVELFEVEFDSTTTLYLHPGVDDTIRVSKIDGSTITVNALTNVGSGTTLTFTGTNSQDGSATSITKTVSGSNPNTNTITLNNTTDLSVGFEVTGPGISPIDYSPIVFDGNTYYALPMEMTDLSINTEGVQNRPTLTIANVDSILRKSSIFQNANDGGIDGIANFKLEDLIGKRITKRSTLKKYLNIDTSNVSTRAVVEYPKRVHIFDRIKQKTSDIVIFELANPFDLEKVNLPGRQVIGKYCPWAYQGRTFSTPTGGCTWTANSGVRTSVNFDNLLIPGTSEYNFTLGIVAYKYNLYFTTDDEPIIWKYLIHNSSSPANILSGKLHPGNTSSTFAKDDLVALSDGGSGYTYWQSKIASNSTVPSTSNGNWRQIRVYEPWVSGETYSTHATDAKRNDYVVHPVSSALSKNDTTFDFQDTTTVFRSVITSTGITPEATAGQWARADICGKSLKSCRQRYQYKRKENAGTGQNTIPSVDVTTTIPLPFGGFPGSRKFR